MEYVELEKFQSVTYFFIILVSRLDRFDGGFHKISIYLVNTVHIYVWCTNEAIWSMLVLKEKFEVA